MTDPWLSIPPEVTTAVDALQGDTRRLAATFATFTTLAQLDPAEQQLLRIERTAREMRLMLRGMRAAELKRLREDERAAARMVESNEKVLRGRVG